MRHLKWWDWLFFAYMGGVSLACWWATWGYFFVLPRAWPMGIVALFGSVLLSVCTAVLFKATVDKANWDAWYAKEKEKLNEERRRLYG